MSDQPDTPPKPKPGSLRDRIAAFEKAGTSAPGPAPPPPRPKPAGFSSWKPKQPSPPLSPSASDNASSSQQKPATGGMSASDAKDSIVKGGSLKERMAALQGKGAFGAPPAVAPKPPLEKPKWKPPPVISPPIDDDDDRPPQANIAAAIAKSPPVSVKSGDEDQKSDELAEKAAEEQGEDGGEVDPEEEERQRRAAITARLARLGGTRVGMAPVFGKPPPPPPTKKPSLPPQEEPIKAEAVRLPTSPPARPLSEEPEAAAALTDAAIVSSPPAEPSILSSPDSQTKLAGEKPSEDVRTTSVESSESHGSRSPPSMPVPAVPRRAAPPRKKNASKPQPQNASTEAAEVSSPPVSETAVSEAPAEPTEPPVSESTAAESLPSFESVPAIASESKAEESEPEEFEQQTSVPSIEEVHGPGPLEKEAHKVLHEAEKTEVKDEADEDAVPVASPKSPVEEKDNVFVEQTSPTPQVDDATLEKLSSKHETASAPPADLKTEDAAVDKTSQEDAEVEDEEVRRKKVAERLARMGGVNPFALPSVPTRRDSATSSAAPASPLASLSPPLAPLSPPATETSPKSIPRSPSPEPKLTTPVEARKSPETKDEVPEPIGIVPAPKLVEKDDESTSKNNNQVEDDDDESEYEDSDGEVAPLAISEQDSRLKSEKTEEAQYSPDDGPSIPVPPPRPSHRDSVQRQSSLRYQDQEEDPELEDRSEEENEDLARSQILPPRGISRSDDDGQTPLPVPHRQSSATYDSQHAASSAYSVPPRRNLPPPPPPPPAPAEESEDESEGGSDNEQALPVRPLSSVQQPIQQEEVSSGLTSPLPIPPPTTSARPSIPTSPSPPRLSPPTREVPGATSGDAHASSSQSSLTVPGTVEVLDEEEGDPIDPSFHSPSRRTSVVFSSPPPEVRALADAQTTAPTQTSTKIDKEGQDEQPQEDPEAARRRTIAERMAKLGGIKFGAAPPVPGLNHPRVSQATEEQETQVPALGQEQEESEKPELTEEEEERARKERIAAKLAGMGGMRIGMMPPTSFPPRKPVSATAEGEAAAPKLPPPPARGPPSRPLPPPQTHDSESEQESLATSEDGVKVEAEESEIEEVNYEDAQPEPTSPPPVPTRGARQVRKESYDIPGSPPPAARPPVPVGLPSRRASVKTVSSQRRASGDSSLVPQQKTPVLRGHSDYVMVEEPGKEEVPPPLPANRPSGRAAPPTRAPPPLVDPQDSISSQWELPAIPTSSLEFGNDDLSMSWTEAEAPPALDESITFIPSSKTERHTPRASEAGPQPAKGANDVELTADELIAVWGRVGVQVCEVATTLFEKSKRSLIGDGTYPGFVRAVVKEVPNAARTSDWGYVVYKQSAGAVQKRASDIMPGDLVEFVDAKFKGHKGLHAYNQSVGAEEPLIGVISEFDHKKSKVRVFHANQNVGQQTVESVSYRLEDLKSGTVKVYRVLEA